MKKILIQIMIITILFFFAGCASKPAVQKTEEKPKPETKTQINVDDLRFKFEFSGFKLGSSNIDEIKSQILKVENQLISKISAVPTEYKIKVIGHTCKYGQEQRNIELSRERAENFVNFISSKYNFSKNRFEIISKGSQELKNPTKPYSKENRRVEIVF